MLVWLVLVTAIAIAALVASLVVLSRLPRQPAPPDGRVYPPQYGATPTVYAPRSQSGYPRGSRSNAPMIIADPDATSWVPRSRCAELNITD
jgi:hypothetical protein